jgi:hypothetical protein
VNGTLTVTECVKVQRTAGSAYYQGLLMASYSSVVGKPDRFYAAHKSFVDGASYASRECGTATFAPGEHRWCYTPNLVAAGHGHPLLGRAIVEASTTNLITVESPPINS